MAGLLCSNGLLAEEPVKNFTGQELIVSATKTLNSVSDAGGSSVTVITAKEIKDSGQPTVLDVIKSVPGIDIVSNGGLGSSSSIYLRGADTKYTLVLIDGVPVNDPSMMSDEANLSNLMVDNIDRIEILRGPSSMLYGSSAAAGVINIITRKGAQKPSVYAGIEGGSNGTYKFYGGGNGSQGPLDYSVSVSRTKTDGFSAIDERNPVVNPSGKEFEKDGYNNTTVSGNFVLKLNEQVSLETAMRYNDASLDYDGYFTDLSGNVQKSKLFYAHTALKIDYHPLLSTLYYNVSDQERKYIEMIWGNSAYYSHLYELGWQGDYAVSDNNTFSVGLNSRNESMSTTDIYRHSVTSNSIFLQDQWHFGALQLVEGIRFEDNEQFGSKTTWRVAPSLTFGNTILKCSYATGFRAPSLYELYAPNHIGNENLTAETSNGWDAGIEHKFTGNLKAGSTFFRTDYQNRIDWVSSTDFISYPWGGYFGQAPGTTKTWGVENFIEWSPVQTLFLNMNYTYLRTKDASDNALARRPRNKVGLTATWRPTNRLNLTGNVQWLGTRLEKSAPDGKLDSYFLANIAGSYKLNEHVELYGRLDNLFDEYYEEAWSYATPGRSAYAGMKVTL